MREASGAPYTSRWSERIYSLKADYLANGRVAIIHEVL